MNETHINTLNKIKEMLTPCFDWEAHRDNDGLSLSTTIEKSGLFTVKPGSNVFECGSHRASDTTTCLYRALFLFGPKVVDFSDMYKTSLFCIVSPDDRFLVQFYLYKFELGLYFFCDKESLEDDGRMCIAGMPGVNNGLRCTDPAGQLFFEVVKQLVETEHEIYGGNNFSV
jgi:hypothetical protein